MITIIEGVDGTGKTTYAKKLAEETCSEYLHASQPKTDLWLKEYLTPILNGDFVLDRWHIGELVWPQIYGRKPLFGPEIFDMLNYQLASMGARLILLNRSDNAIADELLRRGEEKEIELVLKSKSLFLDAFIKVKYIDKQIIDSEVVHNVYCN